MAQWERIEYDVRLGDPLSLQAWLRYRAMSLRELLAGIDRGTADVSTVLETLEAWRFSSDVAEFSPWLKEQVEAYVAEQVAAGFRLLFPPEPPRLWTPRVPDPYPDFCRGCSRRIVMRCPRWECPLWDVTPEQVEHCRRSRDALRRAEVA